MANGYFNHSVNVIAAGVRALAAQVNNIATEIAQGFDKLPTETELKTNTTIYAGADTGAADAYVASLTYTPTYSDGLNFFFKAANDNTGPSTLNLNALGAKSILLASGAALVDGDILENQQIWLAYESVSDTFRIMSQSSSAGGGGGNATTIALADEASDTTTFVLFAGEATGNEAVQTNANLTFDASAGNLGATTFTGALTGNVTGNADTVTTNANLTGDVTSVGNATTTVTNANLTGDVTSVGNATTTVTNANLTGGVTSVGNAATVVTNANLTGSITSVGNATTVAAAQPTITSVGTLTSLTSSGTITGQTIEATGDTAADDNAAMGYTATEGLILTGQGSVNDVTIKNDADADVISVPTGTTGVTFAGDLTVDSIVQPKIKIVEIGDWDMVTFDGNNKLHGLTYADIRSVSVTIRNDSDTERYDLAAEQNGTGDVQINWGSSPGTTIRMERAIGGLFDSTAFDSTSYNRGWMIITYV